MSLPVIDIHCDLLSYLQEAPNADPFNREEIGSSFPSLKEGNVKLQVMAIYTATEKGSTQLALGQSRIFKNLLHQHSDLVTPAQPDTPLRDLTASTKVSILAAIENASGFCEEDEPLENGFKNLEHIIQNTGRVFYIGLTHHGENRFGGGNSTRIGLKADGKALLHYLDGKQIAIDFSHTSDRLAYEMLNHISKYDLEIPVIASHSNFRTVFDHPRNLPDEIAKEIVRRNGLIGVNFLRAFLNDNDPDAIYDHFLYGLKMGGNSMCFGADYFYTANHPDQSRKPFFFKEHENSACYPSILARLAEKISREQLEAVSYRNAAAFMQKLTRAPHTVIG
jgi:membrane dipeptidase